MALETLQLQRKFKSKIPDESCKNTLKRRERVCISSEPVKMKKCVRRNIPTEPLYKTNRNHKGKDSDPEPSYHDLEADISDTERRIGEYINCTKGFASKQENKDPNAFPLSQKCKKAFDTYTDRKRNESSQISAILQPEIYNHTDSDIETKVRKTKSKINWTKSPKLSRYHKKCSDNVLKKPKIKNVKRNMLISDKSIEDILIDESNKARKFDNECYCAKYPERPLIRSRIPAVPSTTETDSELYSFDTLTQAKEVIDYVPESEFLKRLRKGAKEVYSCQCNDCWKDEWKKSLKYTVRREYIEKAYNDLEEERNMYKTYEQNCLKSCQTEDNLDDDESRSEEGEQSQSDIICFKINSIDKYRKNNYFETHSTEDLVPKKPHRCVHKFELDERMLPKPLNADVYGTSRCTICEKPMVNKKMQTHDLDFRGNTIQKNHLEHQSGLRKVVARKVVSRQPRVENVCTRNMGSNTCEQSVRKVVSRRVVSRQPENVCTRSIGNNTCKKICCKKLGAQKLGSQKSGSQILGSQNSGSQILGAVSKCYHSGSQNLGAPSKCYHSRSKNCATNTYRSVPSSENLGSTSSGTSNPFASCFRTPSWKRNDSKKVSSHGFKCLNKRAVSSPNFANKSTQLGTGVPCCKDGTTSTLETRSLPATRFPSQRKINIGSGSDILDLKVHAEPFTKEAKVRFKGKVAPHNSLALRYQKGVI